MDPAFAAPAAPSPVPLTSEDRTILAKQYFLLVTVYRYMLIGMAVAFGGLWLWVSVTALQEPDMGQFWLIMTIILVVLVGFGIWSTPVYWKNTATPLTQDLDDDRKICLEGELTAIRHLGVGRNQRTKVFVQTQYKPDLEEFTLPHFSKQVADDALVEGSEIALEYTPHARFILRLALRVPLTPEEQRQRRTEENKVLVGILLSVSALTLGLGWLLDILVPMALVNACAIVMVLGIVWHSRRQP